MVAALGEIMKESIVGLAKRNFVIEKVLAYQLSWSLTF